jgi:hypothetical protein
MSHAYWGRTEKVFPAITPGGDCDKKNVVRPYRTNDRPGKVNGALTGAPPEHGKGIDCDHLCHGGQWKHDGRGDGHDIRA